jgi:hypothetical protein
MLVGGGVVGTGCVIVVLLNSLNNAGRPRRARFDDDFPTP